MDPVLHWSFRGDFVLIPSIHLHSLTTFLVASSVTICLCAAERCLSQLLENHWNPFALCSRWQRAAWQAVLYWLAMFMRLNYMLIAMTFHLGLILVIVTSLATTQFFIDLMGCSKSQIDIESCRPIDSPEILFHRTSVTTRPRSRSKPEAIFIHPAQSNLARADAAALELGLSGDTDRVYVTKYDREEAPWVAGAGQQAARTLLGRKMPDTWERDPLITDDPDSG